MRRRWLLSWYHQKTMRAVGIPSYRCEVLFLRIQTVVRRLAVIERVFMRQDYRVEWSFLSSLPAQAGRGGDNFSVMELSL